MKLSNLDKFVKIFGTTKAAENFIIKQFGEDALNDPEVQSLLSGKVNSNNGIKLGNGAIIIKDNIKTNYDATGDTSGANSVHHEVMHFILENSTAKELNTLRKDITKDLNNIKDPKFKSAVEFAIKRVKEDYTNIYRLTFFTKIIIIFKKLKSISSSHIIKIKQIICVLT